ncbi:transketolase [Dethiobacter alkaliphilus]|uniref:Transketolase n=1 Tax=Dethiobacter alkaliphilus AHT 1 TaxID=555088 RepID=C0GHF5_DETAL|nr:transketolase [Dethiobacter alkaliphilus]EEG77161.1 transketolase [Dethiobacter alkaliphilus AHT 1]
MKNVQQLAINTIRMLAVDAVEAANSGHPGLPMGGAPMAYKLWSDFMQHSPGDPAWPNRDRFVLSAGHGSMLLYALLHLFGYDLSLEELKNFRQWGSKTPGHPEYGHTVGVETTTGPLGQGFANAVGMAIAERRLAAEFNKPDFPLVDHYTYVYTGDGCMMEGITSEAASLAGHLGLGRLICLYDDNEITIDGGTEVAFTEDVAKRYEAYGWQVMKVSDGTDLEAIDEAIAAAKKDQQRPSLILVRTAIGHGSPNKQGKASAHGAPLGTDEVKLTKENLNWLLEPPFHVPDEVKEHFAGLQSGLEDNKRQWDRLFSEYRNKYPEDAARWDAWHTSDVPVELEADPALWEFDKPTATRAASGQIMQVLAKYLPNMAGGSADLNASTKTYLKGLGDFTADNRAGNNIYFGVREHAMGAIMSGMALHGGLRPYGSTFLAFFDYMKPAVRLAALMGIPVTYVYTHDSIGVGEDGPTHQPIEHLANMRSIPNLHVLRPADGKETAAAWLHAVKRSDGPVALVLTRQNLPQLEGTGLDAVKGGYIVSEEEGGAPDLILMASGSEVSLAVKAQKELQSQGVNARVVSMMSWELFQKQPESYRNEVLPPAITKRLAIETGHPMGWERYTGIEGDIIAIDHFGASAPGDILMEKFGFTLDNVVQRALRLLGR